MSAVSLFYYLQVLKQIYVLEGTDATRIAVPWVTQVTLVVLALGVVLLGCFPGWLVGMIEHAMKPLGH
jgi:NADH-quinone oxidoreductase subunit N